MRFKSPYQGFSDCGAYRCRSGPTLRGRATLANLRPLTATTRPRSAMLSFPRSREASPGCMARFCDHGVVSDETTAVEIPADDPKAVELLLAVHSGDIDTIRRLLRENPQLARAWIVDSKGFRTPLHMVADWPGYFPNGPQIVRLLIQAGADPSFRHPTRCDETPLHWAASSDDVDVAAALIDGGADIEVPGGSIGTPLANAVGYGCWHVARLLVARGARIGIDAAFWQACHGGQRRMAEHLLAQGANINFIPEYSEQTALQAAGGTDTQRQTLVDWLRECGAAGG